MPSRTQKQTSAKYVGRGSPAFKASEYCGQIMVGNDNTLYESVQHPTRDYCQWRPYKDDSGEEIPSQKRQRKAASAKRHAVKEAEEPAPKKARKASAAKKTSAAKKASAAKKRSGKRTSARKRQTYINVPARTTVYRGSKPIWRSPYKAGDHFVLDGVRYEREDGFGWIRED